MSSFYPQKGKHRFLTAYVFFFYLLLFFPATIKAQDMYVRVSENDCINCYAGFFDDLLSYSKPKDFKFLFPKNYQGKRFEMFNQMYLRGKLVPEQVVFSDSLFQMTKDKLNGLSGLVVIYNGEILLSIPSDEVGQYQIKQILTAISRTVQLLDLKEEGYSNNLAVDVSYSDGKILILDPLFRKIYFLGENGEDKIVDLKSDIFQSVLQHFLTNTEYASHVKNRNQLKNLGKYFPESFVVYLKDSLIYLKYYMPYILKQNNNLGVWNMPLLSVLPARKTKLTAANIARNTYLLVKPTEYSYYPTRGFTAMENKLYSINQMIYTEEDVENNTRFPFLNKMSLDKDKKEIIFSNFSKGPKNFSFQEDPTLNSKKMFMNISFLSLDDQILLTHFPFAVNINENKKYKLDWDAGLNDYHFPPTVNYENIQLWHKNDNFVVLVKIKDSYFLKNYSENWELINKIELPFNPKMVKKIRFTKDNIYLLTENELLKMPNVFASLKSPR